MERKGKGKIERLGKREIGKWEIGGLRNGEMEKIRGVWCARPRPYTTHIAPRKTLESGRGCKIQSTTLQLHMAVSNYGKNGDAAQKPNQLEKKAI